MCKLTVEGPRGSDLRSYERAKGDVEIFKQWKRERRFLGIHGRNFKLEARATGVGVADTRSFEIIGSLS